MTPSAGATEVRERLITAASELLAEQPGGSVSVREIAERAGLHHSLIHRHFGGKEQLLRAVVARHAMRYWEAVYTASVTPDDPTGGFQRAFDYAVRDPAQPAGAFVGAFFAGNREGGLQESFPGVELHLAQLERALAGRVPRRDPRIVTVAAIAFLGGWSMLEPWAVRAADLDDLDLDAVRDEVAGMLDDFVRGQLGLAEAPINGVHPRPRRAAAATHPSGDDRGTRKAARHG